MHHSRSLFVGLALGAVGAAAFAATTLGGGSTPTSFEAEASHCSGGCRPPPVTARWHYQLQGKLRLSTARVFDIDGFDTPAAFVSRVRARGGYSICYVDAGTWENWRTDRGRFPEPIIGRRNGWPGERWLDIRRLDVLGPIVRDRMETCRKKGFDAVEADNVDGYSNRTGFPLTSRDQLTYNRYLARTAHRLGLAVGLKNDLEQVKLLQARFDFAVVEQCFEFDECDELRPFTRSGKPVFEVEYNSPRSKFCPSARKLRINALSARMSLAGPGIPCGS